jgi:hypothetical protein
VPQPLGQFLVASGAVGVGPSRQGRQEVLPHRVEHDLHLIRARVHRDDGVVFGQDHHELAEGAVAAVAVAGHPELEAVALLPVDLLPTAVGRLERRGSGGPTLGQDAFAVPHPVVEVQLAQAGDRVEAREHAGEAHVGACDLPPSQVTGADRVEHPASEVIDETFAGNTLEDAGERQDRRLVVGEQRAGFGVGRDREEAANRIVGVGEYGVEEGLGGVSGRHRGDVADPHATDGVGRVVVEQFGQMVADEIVERQQTVGHQQAERGTGERLAERVDEPAAPTGVRRPVALGDAVAVALDDQPVRLDARVGLDRIEE